MKEIIDGIRNIFNDRKSRKCYSILDSNNDFNVDNIYIEMESIDTVSIYNLNSIYEYSYLSDKLNSFCAEHRIKLEINTKYFHVTFSSETAKTKSFDINNKKLPASEIICETCMIYRIPNIREYVFEADYTIICNELVFSDNSCNIIDLKDTIITVTDSIKFYNNKTNFVELKANNIKKLYNGSDINIDIQTTNFGRKSILKFVDPSDVNSLKINNYSVSVPSLPKELPPPTPADTAKGCLLLLFMLIILVSFAAIIIF